MQCGARGSFSDESRDKQDLMCAPHKDKKYSGEKKIKQMVRGSVEAPQWPPYCLQEPDFPMLRDAPECEEAHVGFRTLSELLPSSRASFVYALSGQTAGLWKCCPWSWLVYAAHAAPCRDRSSSLLRWATAGSRTVSRTLEMQGGTSQSSTPNSREESHSRINESCKVCRLLAQSSETWTTSRSEVALWGFWLRLKKNESLKKNKSLLPCFIFDKYTAL